MSESVTANDVTPLPAPEVLTAEEGAGFLRMNLDSFYVLLQRGVVPGAGKIGGAWRIHRPTLVASLAGGNLVPAAGAPRKLPRKRARR